MSFSSVTESRLHYLVTIYEIASAGHVPRSREIAERLGVSRPSVTGALRALADGGYVRYEPYGTVELTDEGAQEARQAILRHRAAYDFFVAVLGMDTERADDIAGEIEKRLPGDLLCRLVQFNDYYKRRTEQPFNWQPHCTGLCTVLYGEDPAERCRKEGPEYRYEEEEAHY